MAETIMMFEKKGVARALGYLKGDEKSKKTVFTIKNKSLTHFRENNHPSHKIQKWSRK